MDALGIAGNRTASVALDAERRSKEDPASGARDIIKGRACLWLKTWMCWLMDPNISVTIIENGKAVTNSPSPKRLVNICTLQNPAASPALRGVRPNL